MKQQQTVDLIDFGPVADFWAGDSQPLIEAIKRDGLTDSAGMREVVLHLLAGDAVPAPLDAPIITRRLQNLHKALTHEQMFGNGRRPNLEAVYRLVAKLEDADPEAVKRWATRNARAKHLIDQHKRILKRVPLGQFRWWRTLK